jgi:hypothetical protein
VASPGGGGVLLHAGSRLGCLAPAFDRGGPRVRRPGHRVRRAPDPHDSVITVLRVQLLTVPQA